MEEKDEDDDKRHCYDNRQQVLLEARQCFMANSVKSKKLIHMLAKCITILIDQDYRQDDDDIKQDEQQLARRNEATELFFNITRLFQYNDNSKDSSTLRRLLYIAIGVLSKQAENIYVVTASLTNDFMNSANNEPSIRASALRTLCRVSQSASTFPSIERYLRQAFMEHKQNPVVVSAALTSMAQMIAKKKPAGWEQIKDFQQQIRDSFELGTPMVQYHALGLLHALYEHDKESLTQLLDHCIQKQALGSPLTYCLIIRILKNYLSNTTNDSQQQPQPQQDDRARNYLQYIKSQLDSNPAQMVEFEAARCLINLESISNESKEYKSAVAHLRNFLLSDKHSLRFASVRALNELTSSSNGSQPMRFWSVHRIGGLCKLHLLNKHYRIGDHIIGLLDFTDANLTCAKYTVTLQCEESQQYELKEEFSLGLKRSDLMITIPNLVNTDTDKSASVLHCVLSFLFYIADQGSNYSKTLFEDRAGTIELGLGELDTKLFSCDFPIAIHC